MKSHTQEHVKPFAWTCVDEVQWRCIAILHTKGADSNEMKRKCYAQGKLKDQCVLKLLCKLLNQQLILLLDISIDCTGWCCRNWKMHYWLLKWYTDLDFMIVEKYSIVCWMFVMNQYCLFNPYDNAVNDTYIRRGYLFYLTRTQMILYQSHLWAIVVGSNDID